MPPSFISIFEFRSPQSQTVFILFLKIIDLFLAVLGLCRCAGFSLVAGSVGYPLVVCGLLIVVVSVVAEPGL